jgi:hypothetical protein
MCPKRGVGDWKKRWQLCKKKGPTSWPVRDCWSATGLAVQLLVGDPLPTSDQQSRAGRRWPTNPQLLVAGGRPTISHRPQPAVWQTVGCPFFCNCFFLILFFGKFEMSLTFWKNGCTVLPFFETCSYVWKCSIFHSSWSLEISLFQISFC